MGDMKEALCAIREAIRIEPGNCMHYRILTYMKTFTEGDPELAAMESLHKQQASMPIEQVVAIKFALNKAYDDLNRKQEAFDLLADANKLMRGKINFSPEGERTAAERTMAAFTHDAIRSRRGAGNLSDQPIFILGMPRSGTSLVEQILSAHPSVTAIGETPAFHKAVEAVLPNYRTDPSFTDAELEKLASRYLEINEPITRGAPRFTDKMLGNLWYVGLIHLTFPNARFVHVVRDPIDTCLSCYATKFGGTRQPFAYDLYELGSYYRLYEELMEYWRAALKPHEILKVRYEDLVQDLRGQTERLLVHVGLEWWERCLSFEDNPNPVSTASAGQVRRPLYRSSIRRWRPDNKALLPLLEGLGPYAGLSHV
ncbi:MAG: sulfotransferase [Pseudomonadota bacterium]|nr:sulfotransferase [Pseudomonadota bacterium]